MGMRFFLIALIICCSDIKFFCNGYDEAALNDTLQDESLLVANYLLLRHRRDTSDTSFSGDYDSTTTDSDVNVTDSMTVLITTSAPDVNSTMSDVISTMSDVISTTSNINITPVQSPVNISGTCEETNNTYISGKGGVSMTCNFTVKPPTRDKLNITWSRRDKPIRKSAGRVTITTTEDGLTVLQIKPVLRRDAGNYSCEASLHNESTTLQLTLVVYEAPRVMLSPSVLSLKETEQQNFTCRISNKEDTDPTLDRLTWCYNNTDISEMTQSVGPGKEVLTVNASSPGTYGCGVENCTETAMLVIFTDQENTCEENADDRGTQWPQTVGNFTISLSCPTGFVGTVERFCNADGIWQIPDYLNCINEKIVDANQTINSILDDTASVDEVADVLVTMAAVTNNKSTTSAGDLDASIDFIGVVVTVVNLFTEFKVDKKIAQSFCDVVGNILSTDTSEMGQWRQVQENNPDKAADLMKSVTDFGLSAARSQSKNTTLETQHDNLVLELGNIEHGDIQFPRHNLQGVKDSFLFPGTNFRENDKAIRYVAVSYKRMAEFLPRNASSGVGASKLVTSTILALAIVVDEKSVTRLFDDITLNFQHTQTENYTEPACGYWDFSDSLWKTDGCTAKEVNSSFSTCHCNHLTNFAILMSPLQIVPEENLLHLKIISMVGCSLSILGCVLTVISHLCLWRYVKSSKSVILINLCVCLTFAYTVFLAGVDRTENKAACTAVAALLHYFFLAAFFLMLAEGVDIAIQIVVIFRIQSKLSIILPLAWGLPAIVVGVTLGVTKLQGYGNDKYCWLNLTDGVLYAFVGPALFVILVNSVIIIATIKTLMSTKVMNSKDSKQKAKTGIWSLCVLMPVLGVTWVFGVLSVNEDTVIFQYLFAVFNSLQGLLIFIVHTLLNRAIHEAIRRRKYRFDSQKALQSHSFVKDKSSEIKRPAMEMTEVDGDYPVSNDSMDDSHSDSHITSALPETWHDQVIDDISYPLPRVSIQNTDNLPVPRGDIQDKYPRVSREIGSKIYTDRYPSESPQHRLSSTSRPISIKTNDQDPPRFNSRLELASFKPSANAAGIYGGGTDDVKPFRIKRSSYHSDIYLAPIHKPEPRHLPAAQKHSYSKGVYASADDDKDQPTSDRLYRASAKRAFDSPMYRKYEDDIPNQSSDIYTQVVAKRTSRKSDYEEVQEGEMQWNRSFNIHL